MNLRTATLKQLRQIIQKIREADHGRILLAKVS